MINIGCVPYFVISSAFCLFQVFVMDQHTIIKGSSIEDVPEGVPDVVDHLHCYALLGLPDCLGGHPGYPYRLPNLNSTTQC